MSKIDRTTRGNSLRNTRINAGVTQKELADHFDVTYQQVQKWETGERPLWQTPYNEMIKWLEKRRACTTVAADHHAVWDYLRRP
jgi:transcriptional regulator with XRE-family HTH domain